MLEIGSQEYTQFKPLNGEIAFDVDVSSLVCGMNGALYLVEMDPSGGKSDTSPAGAAYGAGYCDAQCTTRPWLNGVVNTDGSGACCNEMDLWEANAFATQLAPHPCTVNGFYSCSGDDCGSDGVCEKSGCDFNPYSLGNDSFYGPGETVDTTQQFTVVTQFLTDDNTSTGKLSEIRRLYVQNGNVITNSVATVAPVAGSSSITESFCTNQLSTYATFGGLSALGEALGRGMTLAMAIWTDSSDYMNWLDSGTAGPCNSTAGDPSDIEAVHSGTYVTFSNIKWGEIGSTH
jgi:cellulase